MIDNTTRDTNAPDAVLLESFQNLGHRLGRIIGPAIADDKVGAVVEDLIGLATELADAQAPHIARAFLMEMFSAMEQSEDGAAH